MLELFNIGGHRQLHQGVHMARERCDPVGGDSMPEEVDGGGSKHAFHRVDLKTILTQQGKKLL
jgi:hypothetical protein